MQHFIPKALTPNRDLKQLGAQWLSDNIRGPHIRSNEITPAIPYFPFRWLPALQLVDKVTGPMREGIALLKGTIVSSLNMLEAVSLPDAPGTPNGNQEPWGNNQAWAFFVGHDGTVTRVPLEETFYAYGSDVHSLLVPANGGVAQTLTYTTRDEDMGRIYPESTGQAIAAGDTLVLPANYPVGVVMEDVYVDYRGMYLNYQTEGKLLTNVYKQGCIEYPYVDVEAFNTNYIGGGGTFAVNVKPTLDLKFRYLWGSGPEMVNGAKIIPDNTGNPTIYTPSLSVPPDIDEVVTYLNTSTYQVVGHLDGLNPKQPHSLNDLHDTMLNSGITGTDTLGIDADLYWFVHECIRLGRAGGGSVAPTRENIKTAIRKGHFGYAHLWFHIK